jgi:hypothetical protein
MEAALNPDPLATKVWASAKIRVLFSISASDLSPWTFAEEVTEML